MTSRDPSLSQPLSKLQKSVQKAYLLNLVNIGCIHVHVRVPTNLKFYCSETCDLIEQYRRMFPYLQTTVRPPLWLWVTSLVSFDIQAFGPKCISLLKSEILVVHDFMSWLSAGWDSHKSRAWWLNCEHYNWVHNQCWLLTVGHWKIP